MKGSCVRVVTMLFQLAVVTSVLCGQSKTGSADDLLPSLGSRLLRSLKAQLEVVDTPDQVVFASLEQQTAGEPPSLGKNLDESIYKWSLELKPGDWWLSTNDYKTAFSELKNYKSAFELTLQGDPLNGKPDKLSFLVRRGFGGFFKRVLSGLTLKGSMSQRGKIVDNLQVETLVSDDWVETFSVTFDPSSFLYSSTNLKDAYAALSSYYEVYNQTKSTSGGRIIPIQTLDEEKCGSNFSPQLCLETLAGVTKWRRFVMSIIPSAKFELVDEFDQIKNGTQFEDRSEKAIGVLTLTWDLQKAFKIGEDVSAAVAIQKAHNELLQTPQIEDLPEPPNFAPATGKVVYQQLKTKPQIDAEWSYITPLDGVTLTSGGLLVGIPTNQGM